MRYIPISARRALLVGGHSPTLCVFHYAHDTPYPRRYLPASLYLYPLVLSLSVPSAAVNSAEAHGCVHHIPPAAVRNGATHVTNGSGNLRSGLCGGKYWNPFITLRKEGANCATRRGILKREMACPAHQSTAAGVYGRLCCSRAGVGSLYMWFRVLNLCQN